MNKESHKPLTTVFNLIILDESGSMAGVTNQTISGCNENLNIIRSSAEKHTDNMRQLVSIYAFQSGGPIKSRYIVKNAKPSEVNNITDEVYKPWGNTPMLDAIGATLSELKAVSETHEDATGIITIITDGYENASTNYTWKDVAALIGDFKAKGWTVNLIGANIDVNEMANKVGIDNHLAFASDAVGTKAMFEDLNESWNNRIDNIVCESSLPTAEERLNERLKGAKKFFSKR